MLLFQNMAKEARELEAFFNRMNRSDLAESAGNLAVEAEKLEDRKKGLDVIQPQVELPGGIRREHLKPDKPLSKQAFAAEFDANRIRTEYAQSLIDGVTLTGEAPDLKLAWPSGRDLGLKRAVSYMEFLQAGQERGYNLLHPEVPLYLRLFDINQPRGIYWAAMDPVLDSGGDPCVFVLEHFDGGLWLRARWASPGSLWGPEDRLVFSVSK